MARTLPWKKSGAQRDPPPATSPIVSPHRARLSPPPTSGPLPAKTTTTLNILDHGHNQAPPASSPSKPKPMSERYMITGLQHDDRWRMVEDEFVAVAHKFTAHLHAAEYERLKEQAKDQNADAIRSLSRPVTGPMTDRVKRNQAVVALKKSQSSSIKRARSRVQDADEDDGDELPWAGTNLEGLMESPRKKRMSLAKIVTTSSDTRAAALLRKDSAAAKAPPLARQRSVRFESDESQDRERVQATTITTTFASRSFETRDSGSSAQNLRRTSSMPSKTAAPASIPVPQRPVPAPTVTVPDDDSDSSVDLGFGDLYNKRRPARRTR